MAPDQGSGYGFVLNHVYVPGRPDDRRGRIAVLDQPASYWCVTESRTGERKSLTFAIARDQHSEKLAFERFSALNYMREELLALFA